MSEPKKGEPWKPKEKFDKKANKAKEQEQKEPKVEVKEQHEVVKEVRFAIPERKNFTSHLPSFQIHSTSSIRNVPDIDPLILHPALIEVGLSYQNGNCMGSTYRCTAFLEALKQLILDFKMPKQNQKKQNFGMVFNGYLEKIFALMKQFRTVNEGMTTAYSFIRHLMTHLFKANIDEQAQKEWLASRIDQFIQQKIVSASELILKNVFLIYIQANDLVINNMKILVYARSYLTERFIIQQCKQGRNLSIYIVDNPPFHEGKQLYERLQQEGIEAHYLLLSHVSYVINKVSYNQYQVDKIFVGASAMFSNGALLSRVGTAFLASLAHTYKKPFHVFCESYKFSEKNSIDSLSWNELAQPISDQPFNQLNLRYDVTESHHINMVISEIGLIPPTSVRVVIREFQKYNYIDQIDLSSLQE